MNSDCLDSFFVRKLTSRDLITCKNITKIKTKSPEKTGLKIGQNLPASGGHARSCDTAVRVRVPVRLDHGLQKDDRNYEFKLVILDYLNFS